MKTEKNNDDKTKSFCWSMFLCTLIAFISSAIPRVTSGFKIDKNNSERVSLLSSVQTNFKICLEKTNESEKSTCMSDLHSFGLKNHIYINNLAIISYPKDYGYTITLVPTIKDKMINSFVCYSNEPEPIIKNCKKI